MYGFYRILSKIINHAGMLIKTLRSLIGVIFFSKFNIRYNKPDIKDAVFLGNGPSLKVQYSDNKDFLINKDIFVSNDFARSVIFNEIKPNNYIIADPAYFKSSNPSEIKIRVSEVIDKLNNVDWDINLFIPHKYIDKSSFVINNNKVKIFSFNHTPCEGYFNIIKYLFQKNLGMPYVKNVLIAALMININQGYKNIFLWGVEHNWMRFMFLNEENVLCLKNPHFISDDKSSYSIWYKENNIPWKVDEALFSMGLMFEKYVIVNKYANYKNVKIINQTVNSLIDAFPKK